MATSDKSCGRESETESEADIMELEAPESTGPSPVALVMFSAAGATGIAGIVTGALSLSAQSDLQAQCPADKCAPDLRSEADDMHVLGIATDILLGASLALAVTGFVLLLTGSSDEAETACGPTGCRVNF